MNRDGVVDCSAIDLFVSALGCPGGGLSCWDSCCPWLHAGCNGDGEVNYGDIDPFVALIGTTGP